jgi:hypothetical protein
MHPFAAGLIEPDIRRPPKAPQIADPRFVLEARHPPTIRSGIQLCSNLTLRMQQNSLHTSVNTLGRYAQENRSDMPQSARHNQLCLHNRVAAPHGRRAAEERPDVPAVGARRQDEPASRPTRSAGGHVQPRPCGTCQQYSAGPTEELNLVRVGTLYRHPHERSRTARGGGGRAALGGLRPSASALGRRGLRRGRGSLGRRWRRLCPRRSGSLLRPHGEGGAAPSHGGRGRLVPCERGHGRRDERSRNDECGREPQNASGSRYAFPRRRLRRFRGGCCSRDLGIRQPGTRAPSKLRVDEHQLRRDRLPDRIATIANVLSPRLEPPPQIEDRV